MTVALILKEKGTRVATTPPDTTIEATARRLRQEGIGALVVISNNDVVGIISERDIVRGLATHGAALLAMKVSDLMTRSLVVCSADTTVNEVMAHMTTERVRHVPVIDDDRLAGIISIGDVVKHRLDEMETEVRTLREYITAH
jgi:CBS domain-containing protein